MVDRAVQADWVDFTGLVRSTRIYASTNPCTILAQLQALSKAGILRNFDAPLDGAIGASASGVYQSVADVASLLYALSSGTNMEVLLPAPLLSIFLADQTTVNPAALAALNAAIIGNLSDGVGNTATLFVGGRLRKSNAYGLTPIGS